MGNNKKTILKKLGVVKRIRVRKREKKFTSSPLTKNQELEKILESFDQMSNENESIEEKTTGLIAFEHRLTDLEFKLKYLNLKDVFDREFGRLFPPYNSEIVIIDGQGRRFSAVKAGYNQISGDLLTFFKVNGLKPGDVISIEYDRDKISNEGFIVNIKSNKKITPNITEEDEKDAVKNKPGRQRVEPTKEELKPSPKIDTSPELKIEMGEQEKETDLLSFEHKITDIEFKLKYLNLRDVYNKEYGRSFPSVNSELIIIDGEGRRFSALKAGHNQVSGDLLSFFKTNSLKPGDVILIDYDRTEISDGNHIIHIKNKK